MKRPKSNKSAKALKVLILTKLDRPQHIATDNRKNREHAKRLKYDFSTGYLIRADQLPAIVEAMGKALWEANWPERKFIKLTDVQKQLVFDRTITGFKAIGILAEPRAKLADARGIDAKEGV
jgi:hypothetical protein